MRKLTRFIFIYVCCTPVFAVVWGQEYKLNQPDEVFRLPAELREISDVSTMNATSLVCIQDEKGILYTYHLKKAEVTASDSFYLDNDYEGIAVVKRDVYVLQSDGTLLEIKQGVKKPQSVKLYPTNIGAKNNEGLCYDKKNNRLLISNKSRSTNDTRDKRMIYAFDLGKMELLPDPVMEINIPEIKAYLVTKYGLLDSVANRIRIRPSAIAIHPITGKLYVISATGFLLCIYNEGRFEQAEMLDPQLFNKAEGICFLKNGDMMVSNEGQNGTATLLRFIYHKKTGSN
jgi:hypothetical protein